MTGTEQQKTDTERTLERRTVARKTIMGGLFAVIVLGVVGGFVFMSLNPSNEPLVAEQDVSLPDFTGDPLISPPDQPLPAPTIPPVPLPDAETPAAPTP
ncbi:MAG: hypothetical protein JNM47_05900 [Hyphomonadaceae bacterium]|nr:hypothetical protein [Hyphomonadaceae bacterium]